MQDGDSTEEIPAELLAIRAFEEKLLEERLAAVARRRLNRVVAGRGRSCRSAL